MPLDPFLQQSQEAVTPGAHALKPENKVFGGRFVLQRHLGQGGMGQVWLAQDTALDQPRALKFVLPALLSDATARKRLRNEARLGTELAHPRIVRVFDFVEESGGDPLAAVVMEFVEGRTLSDLLADQEIGFFEPEAIERWVQDITEGLRYAHEEKQRFHLDLKPGNIIVETATGRAKLLDFGISRSAKDTLTRLTGQVSSGTLPYMSPQQLDGEAPCAADDVYSLGATIYELLTGTPPFFRGKLDDQIRNKVPESIMDRRRQNAKEGLNAGVGTTVPSEWESQVTDMLAKPCSARRLYQGRQTAAIKMSFTATRDAVAVDERTLVIPSDTTLSPPVSGTGLDRSEKPRADASQSNPTHPDPAQPVASEMAGRQSYHWRTMLLLTSVTCLFAGSVIEWNRLAFSSFVLIQGGLPALFVVCYFKNISALKNRSLLLFGALLLFSVGDLLLPKLGLSLGNGYRAVSLAWVVSMLAFWGILLPVLSIYRWVVPLVILLLIIPIPGGLGLTAAAVIILISLLGFAWQFSKRFTKRQKDCQR